MPILERKILVPVDATTEGIIANTKLAFEQAGLTIINFDKGLGEIVGRDLECVRGKTLDVLMNDFDHGWKSQESRDLQKPSMFDGNAAACLIWIAETKPHGRFVSISNDESVRDALFFNRGDGGCEFNLYLVSGGWNISVASISFRAISVL